MLELRSEIFNIVDTLEVCEKINRPMVLDYHHYVCNSDDVEIKDYFEKIFSTWENINPKIHFSSPKSKKEKRRQNTDKFSRNDFMYRYPRL